ncbi:MAG: HAMP domain-containing sensor histidine kinase [Planctomycetota bacterium]
MLQLPAIKIDDAEFQLPVEAQDVIQFCRLASTSNSSSEPFMILMVASPSLLIYSAFCYREWTGNSVSCWRSLEEFVATKLLLQSDICSEFLLANNVPVKLDRSIERWCQKPNFKRLAEFLKSVTGVKLKKLKLHLETSIGQQLDWAAIKNAARPDLITTAWSESEMVHSFWEVCKKLQLSLEDFEQRLQDAKLKAIKNLAYGASHEINNPLANIATRAQSLMHGEKLESRQQQLAVVYSQAIRAHEMISDLMLFASPPPMEARNGDILDLIEELESELRSDLTSASIRLTVRRYPGVVPFSFDPTHLAEALKAMIKNSIIAIGSHGEIRIQIWREDDDNIGLAIVDDGPGIDPEIAGEVFDPFYSGREAGRGLGFGLTKAWRVMDLHHGTIRIDSEFTSGSRFVMTFPIGESKKYASRPAESVSRIDRRCAA